MSDGPAAHRFFGPGGRPVPRPRDRSPTAPRQVRGVPGFGLALVLLLTGLVACAGGAFQQHYEAGDYAAAAEVFRADPSLHEDEDVLYRMALLQAVPGSPVYDPGEAERTLERLLRLHPDGERRHEAGKLLTLIREKATLRTQLEQLKAVDLEEPPPRD